MHRAIFALTIFIIITCKSYTQQPFIVVLDSGHQTSLRGLSVVDDRVIWASGSNGTIARSANGGKTFEWFTVKGYEQRDFRDIEAFDSNTAIIIAVAEPAVILKTKDGGKSWYKVFEDSTKGMFLDAMDFVDDNLGLVIGDPIAKKPFMAGTRNQGEQWTVIKMKDTLADGEAFFASSGTNIRIVKNGFENVVYFVSGGKQSRIFLNNSGVALFPVYDGVESSGANSIAVLDKNNITVVGGDYANNTDSTRNCLYIKNGNPAWSSPQTPPHGYRSCAEYISHSKLISCGTSGVDISYDGGTNWQLISAQGFHVCRKAKKGNLVFLVGSDGKIGVVID